MRAVRIERSGSPETLRLIELEAPPAPAAGQVTIDVAYAGVNFADTMFRRGTVAVPLPLVPGIEVSGWVRETGPGVTSLSPGQPVVALTIVDYGAYAEIVTVDARLVAPLPGDDDELLAVMAGVPSNTTTALMALDRARLTPGETILVHAAASGLGSQLGQVATHVGASTVVGTVGTAAKVDAAAMFGYTDVLLRDQWAAAPSTLRPDVIVDPVGGPTRMESLERIGADGRIVLIGNASDAADIAIGANDLFLTSRTMMGFSLGAIATESPQRVTGALDQAVRLVAEGSVRVDVNTVLNLDQAVEAHRRVDSGSTTGKTVLRVSRTS